MSDELADAAALSELTGEELIARGEAMLALGRKLLMQAATLSAASNGAGPVVLGETNGTEQTEERSIGRLGAVDLSTALRLSKQLGEFTRLEFVEASGLKASSANRWLSKLMEMTPPALVRNGERYHYQAAPEKPIEHRAPVEKQFIGMPDPVRAQVAHVTYPKTSDKAVNEILARAWRAGWTITKDKGGKHLSCYAPSGPMQGVRLGVSASPPSSAHHAIRADFKRWGLDC